MICLLICTFLVMGSMAVWADQTGAVSGQPRVFDQAGLFSETEIIQLEEKIAQCRKSTKMDVVIVSAYADGERSAEEYADDYYDYGGFGVGKKASGVLLTKSANWSYISILAAIWKACTKAIYLDIWHR